MLKKLFNKYGFTVITTFVLTVVFALGFVIGMYGRTAPSLEVIEQEQNKQTQAVVVSDVEATTPEVTEPTPEYIELTVTATAYCPCKKCSDNWGDLTATGVRAKEGRTIAVDPSVIPYGTEVIINGNTYIAEDCGGLIKGNKVDIYFDTHEETLKFGKQQLIAKVVKK